MASSTTGNIVVEWLRSLHLGQYAESFIDNGYDDLEICKQVGEPDLDAIGVLNPAHRQRLLHSVRTLREEGAAAVYFTLEEAAAARESCRCEEEARKEQATAQVEPAKYADEYEEGKAELVKIPRMQLKRLLRERLAQDGIRLSLQPYSTTVSVSLALTPGQCSRGGHTCLCKCRIVVLMNEFVRSVWSGTCLGYDTSRL